MAFTYDPTLASALDRIRFWINDTTTPGHLIEDEEILGILATGIGEIDAACQIAAVAAQKLTKQSGGGRKSVGRLTIEDVSDWIERLGDVCAMLRDSVGSVGPTAIAGGVLTGASKAASETARKDTDRIGPRFDEFPNHTPTQRNAPDGEPG